MNVKELQEKLVEDLKSVWISFQELLHRLKKENIKVSNSITGFIGTEFSALEYWIRRLMERIDHEE
jgi:hypothetical protein